jgi:hypothetical protein
MLNVPGQAKPLRYLYLDAAGIEGLYAQTVKRLEIERSTTIEKARSRRVGVAARLKGLLPVFLAGAELEVNGDLTGSRKATEESKQVWSTEQRLASLIETLTGIGEPTIFTELARATQHADATGETVFAHTEDKFDVPQFYSSNGSSLVSNDGYVVFEKEGAFDYEPEDRYYKKERLSRRAMMSASILKMPNSLGGMAFSGHDAVLFRGFNGRGVPLVSCL